jgi:RNA polymerase sigma-70 factor (ECF subfamily)
LRRAQFGDRAAFGQIVLRYQDRLYNSILRLVGDTEEARELTQETFTRALVKIESFRGEAGPYTWLFRIAANALSDRRRRAERDQHATTLVEVTLERRPLVVQVRPRLTQRTLRQCVRTHLAHVLT